MNPTTYALLVFIIGNILWLIGGVGWPSLLILFALTFLPGISPGDVFAHSFGHPTVAFLLFTFLLSGQLRDTGVLRRIIYRFLSLKWARHSFFHRAVLYAVAVFVVGSFVAPTVCFLLFFAIHAELCKVAGYEKGSAEGSILMVITACFSSISCAATPIAHTFPLMAMNFYQSHTGEVLSQTEYLAFAFPLSLILAVICFALVWFWHRGRLAQDGMGDKASQEKIDNWLQSTNPPLETEGKISLGVFILVLLAWLLPAFIPALQAIVKPWGQAWPPLVGVLILSILRVNGEAVLDLPSSMKKHIHGGSLLICSAALALGHYLALPEIGVTTFLTDLLSPVLGGLSTTLFLILIAVVTIGLTNILSNLVTTTLMCQIALPLLMALAPEITSEAAIIIGFGASLAFALPPSIAHIALAGSSGWTTVKTQAKIGFTLAVLAMGLLSLRILIL